MISLLTEDEIKFIAWISQKCAEAIENEAYRPRHWREFGTLPPVEKMADLINQCVTGCIELRGK